MVWTTQQNPAEWTQRKPTENGYYWMCALGKHQKAMPVKIDVSGAGIYWVIGRASPARLPEGLEYLGPIEPPTGCNRWLLAGCGLDPFEGDGWFFELK
jgi:hypothetical protein